MPELRISVTTLDAFHLMRTSDWYSEAKFIQDITTRTEATPQMEFGSLVHKLIEDYPSNNAGCEVNQTILDSIEEFYKTNQLLSQEVKVVKPYYFHEYTVNVVGKVDGLNGLLLHEHKTTPRFTFEKFRSKYQWRFYLDMFNLNTIQYNGFVVKSSVTAFQQAETLEEALDAVTEMSYESFRLDRYPNISRDCRNLVHDFLDFLLARNLTQPFILKYYESTGHR